MEDIPGRTRRDSVTIATMSPSDSKGGFMRGSKSFHGRGSSKTYNVKGDDLSSECISFSFHSVYSFLKATCYRVTKEV